MPKIKTTKSNVDRPLLRRKVREVLVMAPTRRFTEAMIADAVGQLVPFDVPPNEIRVAIDWNLESGLVDYKFNRDLDRDEWSLTDRGLAKEGL